MENIYFKDYYKELRNTNPATEIKKRIMIALEISNASFYNKMEHNNFKQVELEKIKEITGLEFRGTMLLPT
jgi:hypothetical protein